MKEETKNKNRQIGQSILAEFEMTWWIRAVRLFLSIFVASVIHSDFSIHIVLIHKWKSDPQALWIARYLGTRQFLPFYYSQIRGSGLHSLLPV
jgi:hypothetical protein